VEPEEGEEDGNDLVAVVGAVDEVEEEVKAKENSFNMRRKTKQMSHALVSEIKLSN